MKKEADPVMLFLTEESLKSLTQKLVEHKRKGNHSYLAEIYRSLHNDEGAGERSRFIELLKLIHPDRVPWHKNRYSRAKQEQAVQVLDWYRRFSRLKMTRPSAPLMKYSTEGFEEYAYNTEDFDQSFHREDAGFQDQWIHEEDGEKDLISVIKETFLGNLDFSLAPEELETLTGELDLSSRELESLKGAEYLRMLDVLNLADNRLDRIQGMENLYNLKELNLSYNGLTDLSGLEPLKSLVYLDLSFNELEDISSLLSLDSLQVVILQGNRNLSSADIKGLETRGVLCIF